MIWGYLLTIASLFTLLGLIAQRMVERHQKGFRRFIYVLAVLALIRGNLMSETLIGFAIAFVINFLFWFLIGRYNKVPNDDEIIKVYGMND